MGFSDTQIVDGQEQHAAEFTCTVCLNLVDAPLLTTCAHVFCTACLQDWFDTKPSCPTCSVELDPRHGAGRLQIASPLAWRVLGRLRMRCTVTGCGWVGEYSELTAHMTSDSAHQATAASPKPRTSASSGGDATPMGGGGGGGGGITSDAATAEALKEAANAKFSQRIYPEAAALYSKAIGLAPLVPTYRLNRAAARYMLGDYRGAITDCEAALKLEPSNAKAFKRLSKAHIELGDFTRASEVLVAAAAAGAAASTFSDEASMAAQLGAWQAEGEAAYGNGDFAMACTFFANILQKTNAVPTRLWMTRAELALGRCDRALRVTREVIKADANQPLPYVLRATALMYSKDLDQASKHLREALRLDPDLQEAQQGMKKVRKLERHMDAGKQATHSRQFGRAKEEYTAALAAASAPQHAPLSAALHAERGHALLLLKEYDDALKDCAIAIYSQDDCKAAWVTRANALHALGRHHEIVADMGELQKTFQNDKQVEHCINRAQFELRKAARPDYYGLLGVPSIASTLEIKAAYKKRALECHPDKHSDGGDAARAAAEAEFKALGEALEVLDDDFKRKLYNEGYDKAAIEERVQAADRAAKNHSKDGCCGGGCH